MTYWKNVDYNLEVLRGNVPGHTMVTIQGHDNTVPSGGPFGLSPLFGGASYVFNQGAISATPAAVGVASSDNTNDNSSGTGALTVRISGLDSSGNAQTADETMNGTTAVTTGESWSAVHSVLVLTTGSNNRNTGTIWVGTGTFTAGVPAVRMLSMEINHNISFSAYYVVPTGKTLYLRQLILSAATSNKDIVVHIEQSADGLQWITVAEFGLEAGDFGSPIIGAPGLVAARHIQMTAQGAASSTNLTAILAAELIDD